METRAFNVGDTVYWKGRVGLVAKKLHTSSVCPIVVMFPQGSFSDHFDTLQFTEDGTYPSYIREPKLAHIEVEL